jgi:choline dehydrogenase-like flavoprotein
MKDELENVLVIGSGLSAYGAITAALEQGAEITVLDIGDQLPSTIQARVDVIDLSKPEKVHIDILKLSQSEKNNIVANNRMPQKTLYGSKFFYSEELLSDSNKLPYSEALGGYSVAWGAAVLPPNESDLPNLPFDYADLVSSIRSLGKHIDLPTQEDGLSRDFPNHTDCSSGSTILLSKSQEKLLTIISKLQKSGGDSKLLVGQARVLTKTLGENSCRYCGMCSHGCIYDSIFSSKHEILRLAQQNRIKYLAQCRVVSLEELNGKSMVRVKFLAKGREESLNFQKVFVSAGAVNSTKIAIKSLGLENEAIRFMKTGGFVRPYFSFRTLGFDWPNQNTQANVFMEVNDPEVSKYWVHSQISTPNEIVILGLGYMRKNLLTKIVSPGLRFFLKHLVLVMTNIHSDGGPYYSITSSASNGEIQFTGSLEIPRDYRVAEKKTEKYLKKKFFSVGLIPIPFTKKGVSNGPGYHIGGSMAMGASGKLSTDKYGRLEDHQRIFFVDTSVLPMIPSTTIGLFTMANAHRIVSKVLNPNFSE